MNDIGSTNTLNELSLLYKVPVLDDKVRLFGDVFVENNENNFKLFVNEKEFQFCDVIPKSEIEGNSNLIKVTLKETKPVTDYSFLFFKCDSLYSFLNVEKMNLSHVTNISHLFTECSSMTYLPDISNWDTSNI